VKPVADERYTVPALERGLKLLGLFSREERVLPVADIARRLAVPRASVFRILHTLESLGFVERAGEAPVYRLGPAVLRLGFEYLASLEITEQARPLLDALRDATNHSAHLVLRDGRDVVFVARAPAANSAFHSIQVGARLPAHATALGRVLLGDLDHAALAGLYGAPALPVPGELRPMTLDELAVRVAADREQGYGLSEGAFEAGICAIAAPVRNAGGHITAAVSITIPAPRIAPDALPALVTRVKETAARLSERLGHRPARAERLAA
jgi:DNA-binding IclR family transcriptional regulator